MTSTVQRADARANHAALIEAAVALVDRGTSIDVSYDDLAAAAGVARATVYRHFPTQEALVRAILEAALDDWEGVAAAIAPGPERLASLFDAWVRWQRNRPPVLDLVVRLAPHDELLRAQRRLEATLRDPIHEARAIGAVPAKLSVADARVALTMLSTVLRSGTPGDRRRAVALGRSLLFGTPG